MCFKNGVCSTLPAQAITCKFRIDGIQEYTKNSLNTPCLLLLTAVFLGYTYRNAELPKWSGNAFFSAAVVVTRGA